jgi:hypothetical protein
MEKEEKVDPSEKKKVKEGISYYAKNLKEKLKLDKSSGERFRKYTEDMAVNARDFSLSFLPEETQKHVLNMNREALLALQSVIEKSVATLDKPATK